MKVFKILLSVIILGAILTGLFGCGSSSNEETPGKQVASVTRGDLVLDITAAGNLALSLTEDLAIDLFFQQGTIAEVLVEEGDTVEAGQVLVRLDADEWEEQITILKDALTTAQRLVTTKERALVTAQRLVTTRESALATV
jgi:multidrug efflux pump subunit AcrA (membrane-fusion protein)